MLDALSGNSLDDDAEQVAKGICATASLGNCI